MLYMCGFREKLYYKETKLLTWYPQVHGKKFKSSTSKGSMHSGHSTCSSPLWFNTDILLLLTAYSTQCCAYKKRTLIKYKIIRQ